MSQRKFNRAQRKSKKSEGEERSATTHQPSLQALVWYREEDWDRLKTMFADGHKLPATYEDWLARAEELQQQVQAAGDMVIKVYIDPETFPQWCAEKGLALDAEARSRLAIEVAQTRSFSL